MSLCCSVGVLRPSCPLPEIICPLFHKSMERQAWRPAGRRSWLPSPCDLLGVAHSSGGQHRNLRSCSRIRFIHRRRRRAFLQDHQGRTDLRKVVGVQSSVLVDHFIMRALSAFIIGRETPFDHRASRSSECIIQSYSRLIGDLFVRQKCIDCATNCHPVRDSEVKTCPKICKK